MTNLAQLPTATLRQLLALSESREALVATLAEVDAGIAKLVSGEAAVADPAPRAKPGRKPRRGKRGTFGGQIVEALESAGSKGIAVSDLAKSLGVRPIDVIIWLETTGKKSKLVEKVERGVYRIAGAARSPVGPDLSPAAAGRAEAEIARSKRKRSKLSAEGRARIIAAQKARWAKVKASSKAKK